MQRFRGERWVSVNWERRHFLPDMIKDENDEDYDVDDQDSDNVVHLGNKKPLFVFLLLIMYQSKFYISIYTYYTVCPKKTLFYVFANISANTYCTEMSLISTELAWQEASNLMRLDVLRYLVHEKIDILGEIFTFIERTITPLQLHEF